MVAGIEMEIIRPIKAVLISKHSNNSLVMRISESSPRSVEGNLTPNSVFPKIDVDSPINHATRGGLLKYPKSGCLDQSQ